MAMLNIVSPYFVSLTPSLKGIIMKKIVKLAIMGSLVVSANIAQANNNCAAALPLGYQSLKSAISTAKGTDAGGFKLDMWVTVVDRDGVVCAVAYSGTGRGDQWPGSRVISAQKANTANAFSLHGLALSTANLYSAVQPGGSLFGLQFSNPVDTLAAYKGPSTNYGLSYDPLVGNKIGGVNVFGGGLALYNHAGIIVGAVGVSGDSSCADHNNAWQIRHALVEDFVPGGVSGDTTRPDNIVYDITAQSGQMSGNSTSGWGHPTCNASSASFAASLPTVSK